MNYFQHLSKEIGCVVSTSWGEFQLVATANGICDLRFPTTRFDDTKAIAPGANAAECEILRQGTKWLQAYFKGIAFECFPLVDFSMCSSFAVSVYKQLQKMPMGTQITYGQLAHAVSSPHAARAVGTLMKKNRTPILVPCHRVVLSHGGLGGWSGPQGWKQRLLAQEQTWVNTK